jgi:hypothetical protein
MLSLLLLSLAVTPGDLPTLKDAESSGFEGSRSASGTLVERFCFSQPTRICAPAGSWVWFTWSVCAPHSNRGCDDTHVTPSLSLLDASEVVEALGLRWAPVVHRNSARGGHTLQLDTEMDGQLAVATTIDGVRLSPGHVSFRDSGRPAPLDKALLGGVWAEAHTCQGWRAPVGTEFSGSCEGELSMTAPPGAWLERLPGPPLGPGATTRAHGVSIGQHEQNWYGVELVRLLEVDFGGDVTLRAAPDGGVASVEGELARSAKLERCHVPAGVRLSLTGEGRVVTMPSEAKCSRFSWWPFD